MASRLINYSAVALVFAVGSSQADDYLDLPLEELLQINITSSSFFTETPQTTANSVTRFDQSQWQRRGFRYIGELLNTAPATLAPPTNGGTRSLGTRGFFGTNTGVALRFDGVPLNQLRPSNSLENLDSFDLGLLSAAEFIRGPGSSVHGADAFLGALSLQSFSPQGTEAALDTSLGSADAGSLVASGSLQQEQQSLAVGIAYRGLAESATAYPYTDPVTGQAEQGERHKQLESLNLLLKYSLQPSDQLKLSATLLNSALDADDLPGPGRGILNKSYLGGRDVTQTHDDTHLLRLGADYEFNSSQSFSAMAYSWQSEHRFSGDYRNSPLATTNLEYREESRSGAQLLARANLGDTTRIAYGYEYSHARVDKHWSTQISTQGQLVQDHNPQADQGYVRDTHSLLFDGRSLLPDQNTEIAFGGRLDDYQDFDRQFSPRLGLIVNFADKSVAKLLYGQAYRAPNLFEILGGGTLAANRNLRAEHMDTLELVYQRQSQHWFGSLTLYENRWRDAIRGSPAGDTSSGYLYQFKNQGQSQAYGAELEIDCRWADTQLDLGVSWNKSYNDQSSNTFASFPDWMLDLGLSQQLGDRWDIGLYNRWFWRRAASETTSFGGPLESAKAYWRTDLSLGWQKDKDLRIRLSLINLFNRDNFLPSYLYHESGIPDEEFGLRLNVNWQL